MLQIEQCLSDADFQLSVELWFTEEELRAETVLQQLSTRTASLHVKYDAGVHHYLPLQFDYFHLSTVLLTVHASLLALHPSYIRFLIMPPPNQTGWRFGLVVTRWPRST